MELASAPPADTPMPASVLELAAGRATRMLWRNDLGGLAIAIDGTEPLVVPWSPPDALPVDDCPWS